MVDMSEIIKSFKKLQTDMDYTKSSLFNAGNCHYFGLIWTRRIARFFAFTSLIVLAMNKDFLSIFDINQKYVLLTVFIANILNYIISELSEKIEDFNFQIKDYKKYGHEINSLFKESRNTLAIYEDYKAKQKKYQNFDDLDDYLVFQLQDYTKKYNSIIEKMPHIAEKHYKKTQKDFAKGTNKYTAEELNS